MGSPSEIFASPTSRFWVWKVREGKFDFRRAERGHCKLQEERRKASLYMKKILQVAVVNASWSVISCALFKHDDSKLNRLLDTEIGKLWFPQDLDCIAT